MKKVFSLVLILGLAMVLLAACGGDAEPETPEIPPTPTSETAVEPADLWEGDMTKVKIEIEDYGDIILELNESVAPITVENFLGLVNDGFYDGLTFHRIIDGFMIQGGDPEGTGMGGSGTNITGEFAANGVDNPITHVRGVISMARSQDFDSASSQFFIVHQDSNFLDREYAGFGRVVEGIEVVDAIAENTPVIDGNGGVLAEDKPVITRITVVD
ncbi:MAG: peptidylprolyl isomerase [Coriobacteriia bacterium]|nr:peptidylprolyl isomerase [Coriobacteriia bacterium]MCL2606777.1 peptidylprolyl isomerase [Coriobacteriia bacterium]